MPIDIKQNHFHETAKGQLEAVTDCLDRWYGKKHATVRHLSGDGVCATAVVEYPKGVRGEEGTAIQIVRVMSLGQRYDLSVDDEFSLDSPGQFLLDRLKNLEARVEEFKKTTHALMCAETFKEMQDIADEAHHSNRRY